VQVNAPDGFDEPRSPEIPLDSQGRKGKEPRCGGAGGRAWDTAVGAWLRLVGGDGGIACSWLILRELNESC
jgi:hypothetical protein